MGLFDRVDWAEVFVPAVPLLETFARGTVVYLSLFALLRFVQKKQAGAVSVTDLLVVVVIADAASNAMAANAKSVADGVLVVATIVFWSFTLDWLGHRYPRVGRVLHPPPVELVRDGRMNRRNMRHELMTEDELMSQLREQGVEHVSEVKRACVEGDGRISVVKRDGDGHGKKKEAVT